MYKHPVTIVQLIQLFWNVECLLNKHQNSEEILLLHKTKQTQVSELSNYLHSTIRTAMCIMWITDTHP